MDAVVALYTESAQGRSAVADANLTIPLLMRNKVPDGVETDDKLDVSVRPDEVCAAFELYFHQCRVYFKTAG